jgi:hypothetical protein
MITIEEIKEKLDYRYTLLQKLDESYNDQSGEYELEEPKEIDEISDWLIAIFKKESKLYPFDFVLESLSKIGWDINLLYDGNGRWSVSGDSFQQTAIDEPINMQIVSFVDKNFWKDSIKEAIHYFLNNDSDDIDNHSGEYDDEIDQYLKNN